MTWFSSSLLVFCLLVGISASAGAVDFASDALVELAESPADRTGAAGKIKDAVAKLEDAVEQGLDAAQGAALMDELAGVVRQLATDTVEEAIAQGGNPVEAEPPLAEGDMLRAAGQFKLAIDAYRDAIEAATP